MVTIESSADRRDGVTLVTATVECADAPTRVRLESRLDGPVWPPRRQGTPIAGWEPPEFEEVVPAEGTLAIGFASPAPPVDPPLTVTNAEPTTAPVEAMDSPAAIVRGLGDPTPPSLIEPDGPSTNGSHGDGKREEGNGNEGCDRVEEWSETAGRDTDESDTEDRGTDRSVAASSELDHVDPEPANAGDETGDGHERAEHRRDHADEPPLPPAVDEWLTSIEGRVDCAEGLEATASVERATESLRTCGGVAGARRLEAELADDVRHLRALEQRVQALADRAESVQVASEALDRLA